MQQLTVDHSEPEFEVRRLYLQVYERFKARMESGKWPIGYKVPNEFALSVEFGVSNGTVRKALDKLEAEGFVIRKQGQGTYVIDPELRMRACVGKSLLILRAAVDDTKERIPPKLHSKLQKRIADALYSAGYHEAEAS